MYNFVFTVCICFFTMQKETKADNCNTLKLEPNQPLLITMFDQNNQADKELWDNVCQVIMEFPKGLISMEFRPGALTTGTKENIKCGSGSCKIDQFMGCLVLHTKLINDCYQDPAITTASWGASFRCYCANNQEPNQLLLDNAALRAKWNVPENAIPALAFNQTYDPCAKTQTYEEIKMEVCKIYQNKVGHCSHG